MNNFPFTINNHVAIASEMQQTRLKLNPVNYQMLKELCYEEAKKAHKAVVAQVGREINVSSPEQMANFLYSELGLPRKKKRKTGKDTTDEDALKELRLSHPQYKEVLGAIIEERHIKKRIESYTEFHLDEDKHIPHSANPAGAEAANRWSFSKSPRNRGFNTQTLPETMRIMVDAPQSRIFICPDLPQADARVVAWDAQCERQIALFNDPARHFHLENCIGIKTGLTKEQVYSPGWKDDNGELYRVGKRRGHAANYREQKHKLAVDLDCTESEAQRLLDDYFRKAPEILRWHDSRKTIIRKTGGLTTPHPFQRHRVFYKAWAELLLRGKLSNDSWNEACAWVPSSTVADIVNVGIERLWEELDYVRFHLHHHDSYLASVPIEHLEVACARSVEHLRVKLLIHDRPLEMTPEMKVGRNWGALVPWMPGESWSNLKSRLDSKEEKVYSREYVRKGLYGHL